MKEVRLQKSDLLAIIRKNRDEHRDIFIAAQKSYREKAIELLDRQLRLAREGNPFVLAEFIQMIPPVDRTEDYDRAVAMLEMSVDSVVTLSADEFSQLVQDEWDWTQNWAFANSRYTTSPKFRR